MKMANSPTKSIPDMLQLLESERAALLLKWGKAYLERAEQCGHVNFWGTGADQIVSDQMMTWRNEQAAKDRAAPEGKKEKLVTINGRSLTLDALRHGLQRGDLRVVEAAKV